MFRCKIDDTGVEFNSFSELAKFLGVSVSWISWRAKFRPNTSTHFQCKELGITILPKVVKKRTYSPEQKAQQKEYYEANKDHINQQVRRWRQNNPDKVRAYKENWRRANQEWYNAYYREKRRKAKEANQ